MMDLYAWIGEDELGSGRVGIKAGRVPAGFIPLAAMDFDRHKLEQLRDQLQAQANAYGTTIRLARFTFVEDVIELQPEGLQQQLERLNEGTGFTTPRAPHR